MTDVQAIQTGKVYLVGGGPGDPDLLTVKALRLIQSADVLVYDALISQPILDLAPANIEKISVGKLANRHTLPQPQINELLVKLAQEGKTVCRLKGGDPYIFGRGGEEAEALVKNDISYEVVPGITAAAACAASTGIPLTHRDFAQSLQFVTGHGKATTKQQEQQPVDWSSLVAENQTLVIYMGILKSPEIKANLISHGRAPETPVAIVEKGSRPDQRVVTGQLSELDILVKQHQIGSPALIIVGEVVSLYQVLNPHQQQEFIEQHIQAA
jgi:uroporphyrin-III C-methyltransferase/precorrin-2 dehydrogenase/sirohydrochlorin ferrochelatase